MLQQSSVQLHHGRFKACTHRVVIQHELNRAELHQLPHTAVREQAQVKEKTPPLSDYLQYRKFRIMSTNAACELPKLMKDIPEKGHSVVGVSWR